MNEGLRLRCHFPRGLFIPALSALLLFARPGFAVSRPAPDPSAASPNGASSAEPAAPPSPWRQGPTKVDLGQEVSIDLTSDYAFLPKELAQKVLEANGNLHNDNVLGLVASADHSSDWFAVATFDAEGYVKDDEAIDADELLSSMREGTEEANKERKERGFKPLTLDGWSDPPRYDKSQHQLTWALIVSDPDGKSVNYNTRILGRKGYVSLNLVTDPEKLRGFKHHAVALLGGTRFNQGSRYEDFNSATDKVAEYGLAGLVMAGAGLGAAKLVKIGLIAKFWKVIIAALIAGKKFIIVALAGGAAYLKRVLGAKKKDEAAG